MNFFPKEITGGADHLGGSRPGGGQGERGSPIAGDGRRLPERGPGRTWPGAAPGQRGRRGCGRGRGRARGSWGVEDAALSTCHLAGLIEVQRIGGPAATAAAVTGGTLGGAENRAGGVERGGGVRALLFFFLRPVVLCGTGGGNIDVIRSN